MYTKLIGALLISATFFSCNKGKQKGTTADVTLSAPLQAENKESADQQIPVVLQDTFARQASTTAPANTPGTNNDWTKKIIKEATVKIEVKNFKNYNAFLNNKVKQYAGYIAAEENNFENDQSQAIISIKVPVQLFDGLMNDITTTDDKLVEKTIHSEDVTGQIADTKARLQAKKEMRLKYLDFLKQSKNMTEVLQVQDEINNIQEEIEAASGRYESLNSQTAYSTINLTFFQPVSGYVPTDKAPSFFTRIALAFKTGASWLSDLAVALISIWPFLIGLAAAMFIYKKTRRVKVV